MAIGTTIGLADLDRGERIVLAAAFQRARRCAPPGEYRDVEEAAEVLLDAALSDEDSVILTEDEADMVHERLSLLVESPEREAPEIVAVAAKVVALL